LDVKQKIIDAVKSAAESAISEGVLKSTGELPEISLEVPPKKEFGDFSTNFAMQTAKIFHTAPRKIADEIKSRISEEWLEKIEIAGAGFMNFYLKADVIYSELKNIFDELENFGQMPNKKNIPIQIEYVSANPTGLLHVGHGRGAAAGSAIVNILRFVSSKNSMNIETVAIPALSSGIFQFPLSLCTEIIVQTIKMYFQNTPIANNFKEIHLVSNEDPTVAAFKTASEIILGRNELESLVSQGATQPFNTMVVNSMTLHIVQGLIERQEVSLYCILLQSSHIFL
jgi:hypothetical protein